MKQQYFLKARHLFFLFITLLSACDRSDSRLMSADTAIAGAPPLPAAPPSSKAVSGVLDTLWIESASFLSAGRQLAFRFYIGNGDTLTLHGWSLNGNVFTDAPNIQLKKGRASAIAFGPGNYFGNLLIRINEMVEIKRLIKSSATKYVLFAPQEPKENNGQITYAIFFSNDDPAADARVLVPTKSIASGVKTNPSPPRNTN